MHHRTAALAAGLMAGMLVFAIPASASPDGTTSPEGYGPRTRAQLVGSEEVPGPGDPNGVGKFSATIKKHRMCYSFKAKKIAAPTAAHIHDGDFGVAGPIIITLLLPTAEGVKECLPAVPDDQDTNLTMSESEYAALRATPEQFYANVHNAAYPAGAIRGQLFYDE